MLILQGTPFCNVDCTYCYLPHRDDRSRMSRDVLQAVFSKILPSELIGDRLVVVWHAGEPLTVPAEWYEDAFSLATSYAREGRAIEHSFQSNGVLIDGRWVEFFLRTGAKISLSLDGPQWLHDRRRRTRNGRGTYEKAIRGLHLLQSAGIAPATISVLTRDSLQHADAMFDFFRDHGICDVAFNVEELEGANVTSSMAGANAESAYAEFLRAFIARMQNEPDVLMLREWRDAKDTLRFGVVAGMNQEAEPLRIISVAAGGAVATFSPELLGMRDERYGDFVLGNIVTDSVETIVARALASTLHREIRAGIANCRRTCGWFDWCGGGSPSNKIFEAGNAEATETAYCRLTRQALFDVVLSTMEHERAAYSAVT